MSRFNLIFRGEVLPGKDPADVRARFAKMFSIDDPERLEKFFSGEPVILRRSLDRKVAAEYYLKTHNLGAATELVKLTPEEEAREEAERGALKAELALRQAQEEASRREAEEEAARRREAEEQARRAEAEEQARRVAAEEQARRQKEKEEARRVVAEEKARKEAEKREARRIAAEEKARREAQEAELRRKTAEERARRQAQEDEARRIAAEEKARLDALAREARREAAEQERARRQAARAQARREARAEAARLRAEAAEMERVQAEEAEGFRAAEDQAEYLAARKLAVSVAPKLRETPPPAENAPPGTASAAPSDDGAPNLFAMRPFRNTPLIRERALQSRKLARFSMALSLVAMVALIVAGAVRLRQAPLPLIEGASDMAAAPDASLWLAAGDRLLVHDRAGIGIESLALSDLGLASIAPPMGFLPGGDLLVNGKALPHETDVDSEAHPALLRCSTEQLSCSPFAPWLKHSLENAAIAVHAYSGELFLALPASGELLKLSADGELLASSPVAMSARPALHHRDGLLFMDSAEGPAISVYRPEAHALGEQLDEVLLLPEAQLSPEQLRVNALTWSGESWWVSLSEPGASNAVLHRFDSRWNHLGQVAPKQELRPLQLLDWADRVLLRQAGEAALMRFGADGLVQAAYRSDLLDALIATRNRTASVSALAWRLGLALLLIVALLALLHSRFHRLRSMVYAFGRSRGAEPVDNRGDQVRWIAASANRRLRLRLVTACYLALAIAAVAAAVGLSVSAGQLTALLLALAGPVIALYLLARSPTGHLGVLDDQLLLVDHAAMYHLGAGPRLQYRDHYLMVDDVVVYTGNRLLPVFDRNQLRRRVAPITSTGIRVDRRTLAVKLLQKRHPVAIGALAVGLCLLLGLCALLL